MQLFRRDITLEVWKNDGGRLKQKGILPDNEREYGIAIVVTGNRCAWREDGPGMHRVSAT